VSDSSSSKRSEAEAFAEEAERPSTGLVREFIGFLAHNKKWWLGPIIFVLLLVGLLVILAGSSVAPFIYTLF
jgi:hypothetical protein